MTPIQVVLMIFLVTATVVVAMVGFQLMMVLNEIRRSLSRVNEGIENVEQKIMSIIEPLQNLRVISSSVSAGVTLIETFVKKMQDRDEPKTTRRKS